MTLHTKLSYAKSLLRVLGFGWIVFNLKAGALLLILAELLGFAEELPFTYKGTKI